MKKLTQTSFALCLLVFPAVVAAASISALDTVAGLATEVTMAGLPPKTAVTLTVTSPEGENRSYPLTTNHEGTAMTWVSGSDLKLAGAYDLSVTGKTAIATGTLNVHPDTVDTVLSFVDISQPQAGVGSEVIATVVLVDRFGNPLSSRSTELVGSRAGDLVQAITRETDENGEQSFIVRGSIPGELSLRAIDLISGKTIESTAYLTVGSAFGSVGGPAAKRTVAYSAPQQFYRSTRSPYEANILGGSFRAQLNDPPHFARIKIEIIGQENNPVPNIEQYKAQSMLLTAVDQFGDQYLDFTGTVYLATTDAEATLPLFGVYNFAFEDEGTKMLTLGLKFSTGGEQIMILTDQPNEIPANPEEALGYLKVNVVPQQVAQPSKKKIIVSSPPEGITIGKSELVNGTEVLVEGNGREFINITITGGIRDIETETDREGNFSKAIALDVTVPKQTIKINDVEAPQNSTERSFGIDVTPPVIESAVFTPENPVEGTDVLLVVKTEASVSDVSVAFNGETQKLTVADNAGKYQILLTAPTGGIYDAKVTVADTLGNIAEQSVTLSVGLKGLPKVESVVAEAQINAIALRWNPVEGSDIGAYRIYVGTDPEEFLYTLDTDRPTAAATVAGLRPGTTYYFAVTALKEQRESEERSDTVEATVLGVKLEVTPGDGAVFIEWTSLEQDMPLSTFLLEYGVEAETYTEQRVLNGDLRAYTLRDLVNGITYYLKLTPIATTGEKLDDLAATGQGTPTGEGYTAGVSDPVPFDLHASGPPRPKPPLKTPLSAQGVPAWVLWSTVGASVLVFRWHLQRKRSQQMTVAFLQAMESRYHR